MIQRIQTLWLLFASLISGLLFIFPLYQYSNAAETNRIIGAKNEYALLLIAGIMTLLSMFAIFMYSNRKLQKRLIWVGILASVSFVVMMLMKVDTIRKVSMGNIREEYLLPGPLLPILSIILLFLAFKGIRKDEKLLKSVDRLR